MYSLVACKINAETHISILNTSESKVSHVVLIIKSIDLTTRIQNGFEIRSRRFVRTSEHSFWHRKCWPRTKANLWVIHQIFAMQSMFSSIVFEKELRCISEHMWKPPLFPMRLFELSLHFFPSHTSRHICRVTIYGYLKFLHFCMLFSTCRFCSNFLLYLILPRIFFLHALGSFHFCTNQHSQKHMKRTSGSKVIGLGRPAGGTSRRGLN